MQSVVCFFLAGLVGLSAFAPGLSIAQEQKSCVELLRYHKPRPALYESLKTMRLWDVMPGVGGDWVALPSEEGMRMVWVSPQKLAQTGPSWIPLPTRESFTVPWKKLGVLDRTLDTLRSMTGHFVESANGFLVDLQNTVQAADGSSFYWISTRSRTAESVTPLLEKVSRGSWRYVGEDLHSGDVFFAKVTGTPHATQWVVQANLRGDRSEWQFRAFDLRRLGVELGFKDPLLTQDLVGVHALLDGELQAFAVRNKGLWVVDTQTRALHASYSQEQLTSDLSAAGLRADQIRYFWDRLHVNRDGISLGWAVSRILKSENRANGETTYRMDTPVVFRWNMVSGQQPQFAPLKSDVASADVYDWVFSDANDSMTIFGNQIIHDSEMRAVVWRWDFNRAASEAVRVLRVGEGVPPYRFSGLEMEARLQREVVREGWVLAGDRHAFGPWGEFVELPLGKGQVGSWSLFAPGFYQIEEDGQLGGVLRWVPFSRTLPRSGP